MAWRAWQWMRFRPEGGGRRPGDLADADDRAIDLDCRRYRRAAAGRRWLVVAAPIAVARRDTAATGDAIVTDVACAGTAIVKDTKDTDPGAAGPAAELAPE